MTKIVKFSSSLLFESLLPGESINSSFILGLSTIVDWGSLVHEFNELLTLCKEFVKSLCIKLQNWLFPAPVGPKYI